MTDITERIRKAQEAQTRTGSIPAQAPVFDDSRNSSSQRPPGPTALRDALVATAKFREEHPEHAKWIEDGYPHLTEDDHIRRFGTRYGGVPWRKEKRGG